MASYAWRGRVRALGAAPGPARGRGGGGVVTGDLDVEVLSALLLHRLDGERVRGLRQEVLQRLLGEVDRDRLVLQRRERRDANEQPLQLAHVGLDVGGEEDGDVLRQLDLVQ